MTLQPRVSDISHHNTVTSFADAAAAGLWGIIHKATQGTGYRDPNYPQRRKPAMDATLLWGAYHFGDSTDPKKQVDNFLGYATPEPDTLIALDYEDHPSGKSQTMKPAQMVAFLREIESRCGRKAVLYSGNRIKEDIHLLTPEDRTYVNSHQLWLCHYSSTPKLPPGWSNVFLWQYTDGVVGPEPHHIAGITGEVDLNSFRGTEGDLVAQWSTTRDTDISSINRRGDSTGMDGKPPRGSDDTGPSAPPTPVTWTPPPAPANGGTLNIQAPTATFNVSVRVVQEELDGMGYHEVGDIDGLWGGKTAAGIKAFFTDRGVMQDDGVPAVAEIGQRLYDEIGKAKAEHFTRPIAPARANATPAQVAPKIESVKVSLWQKFGAQITAAVAGLGFTGSTLSSAFSDVQSKLQPLHDAFAKIPPEIWFGIMGIVAVAVWYGSTRAANAATKDYNTGRTN